MSDVRWYRQRAAELLRQASHAATSSQRDMYLGFAEAWRKLAQDREEALGRRDQPV
jgi:hypothetical protein